MIIKERTLRRFTPTKIKGEKMALLKDTGTVIYCVNDILLLLQYSFFKNLEKHKDNPFIAEILFKAKSTFKYSNQIESLVKREIDYFTIDEFTHLLNLLK